MAKALAKKPKKRTRKSMLLRTRGSAKRSFAFPSNKSVQAIDSDVVGDVKANAGLKKLQRTYKSAGYQILGTTDDGVVIVRPTGKPDSFELTDLQKVFSGSKHAKVRRAV
jgi:hypothetical protein